MSTLLILFNYTIRIAFLILYRKDVYALQQSLESLGRHGYNTSPSVVEQAYETLKKYEDLKSAEVQWRLARALVEKAFWMKENKDKLPVLHEAKELAKQAISLGGDSCAGAHKWYAIILHRLGELDKKANYYDEMVEHLEKAVKLDEDDVYSVHLLGVVHYKHKKYEEALRQFEKAEHVREKFSPCNLYYYGAALLALGRKEEAIKHFIQAYKAHAHNEHEVKARADARTALLHLNVDQALYEIHPY
ncbi:unnamed protein product [Cylicocyclus nassatus]|uniref:Uncharacterized protein n=1 Tax=Cylicocyclus nassatus TaxID=53992 RepID=A0AA36GJ76_CYLNA|nr:unnamed protein product [Cylicocyclus nassatus]